MAKQLQNTPEEKREIKQEILHKMLDLTTSGFGLVAALAWNEFIKEVVNKYIQPLVGGLSGLISLFIYAVLVTTLAVIVTLNLSRLSEKN